MQKRIVAMMLAAMMAVTAIGCGDAKSDSGAEGTESIADTEYVDTTEEAAEPVVAVSRDFILKGADYVTLCDYSKIPVEISGDYTVTDEDVKAYFENVFASYGPFYTADPDKTTIGEGDIVNVDYVGKLDGEAFDGGTAENQDIDVYGNCAAGGTSGYIDGFTEGLKGAKVGDVIDCDVTFPENYGSEDLAGKAVVFTFTVNSIQKEITADEMDDAFAQTYFGAETVDEMKEMVKASLESQAEYNKQSEIYELVQNYLMDNCTVEVPQDYVEARVTDYRNLLIRELCSGDETQLESAIDTYYGTTLEEAEAEWQEAMSQDIKLELILDAIAEEMEVTLEEEEYASYMNDMISGGVYSSVTTLEDLYEMYGYGDLEYGEEYARRFYVLGQAMNKVAAAADVTVAEAVEDAGTEGIEGTEEK